MEHQLLKTRARALLICATALGFTAVAYAKGSPKGAPHAKTGKGKGKGQLKGQPVIAVPEPSALAESLIYLTGVVGATWFMRRRQKLKQQSV